MGPNIALLMARAIVSTPVPARPLNESESKALFYPIQHFQLGCLFAMLVMTTFLLYVAATPEVGLTVSGVFCVLLLRYVTDAKNDNWWIKGLVVAIAIQIIAHACECPVPGSVGGSWRSCVIATGSNACLHPTPVFNWYFLHFLVGVHLVRDC